MKKAASNFKLLAKEAGLRANGPLPLASKKNKSLAVRTVDPTQASADYPKSQESGTPSICTGSREGTKGQKKAIVTKLQHEGVHVDRKATESCCDIAVKLHPHDAYLLGLVVAKSNNPTECDAKVKINPVKYIRVLSHLPALDAEKCEEHLSLLAKKHEPILLHMKRPPSVFERGHQTWSVYFALNSPLLKSIRTELKDVLAGSPPQIIISLKEQKPSNWSPMFPLADSLSSDEAKALSAAGKFEWKTRSRGVSLRATALCLRIRSASAESWKDVIDGSEWKEWPLVGNAEERRVRLQRDIEEVYQKHKKACQDSSCSKPVEEPTNLDITAAEDESRKILVNPSKGVMESDGPGVDNTTDEMPRRTPVMVPASSLYDDAPVLPPMRYKTAPHGARAKESTQRKAQLRAARKSADGNPSALGNQPSQYGTGWVQPRPLEREARNSHRPMKRDLRKAPTVLEKLSFPEASGWVRPLPSRSIMLERPVPDFEPSQQNEKLPRATVLDSPGAKVRSENIYSQQQQERTRPTSEQQERPHVLPQRIVLGSSLLGGQSADRQPEQVASRTEHENVIPGQVSPPPGVLESLKVGSQIQDKSLRSAQGYDASSSNASSMGVLRQSPGLGQGKSKSKQPHLSPISPRPSISELARVSATRVAGQLEDKPLLTSPKDHATEASTQSKHMSSHPAEGNPAHTRNLSAGRAHQRSEPPNQTQVHGPQLSLPGIATVESEPVDKRTEKDQLRENQAAKAARAMSEAMKIIQPYVTQQASIEKSTSGSSEKVAANSQLGWSSENKFLVNNPAYKNVPGEAISAESIRSMLDPPKPAPSPRKSIPLMEWDAVRKKAVFVRPNLEGLSVEAIAEYKLAQKAMKAEIAKETNPAPQKTSEFYGNILYKMVGRRQPMLLYHARRIYKVVPENAEPGRHYCPQPISRAISSEPQHHDQEKKIVPYPTNDHQQIQVTSRLKKEKKKENSPEEAGVRYHWARGSDPEREVVPRFCYTGESPLLETQSEMRGVPQHQDPEIELVPELQPREEALLSKLDEEGCDTKARIHTVQSEADPTYPEKKDRSKGWRPREQAARQVSEQEILQKAKAKLLESTPPAPQGELKQTDSLEAKTKQIQSPNDSLTFKIIGDKGSSGPESQAKPKPRQWKGETKPAQCPNQQWPSAFIYKHAGGWERKRLREGQPPAKRDSRTTKPVRDLPISNPTLGKDENDKGIGGARAKKERGGEKMGAREEEDVEFMNAVQEWATKQERNSEPRGPPYRRDDTRKKEARPRGGGERKTRARKERRRK
ncbi:hypothetical protein QTJ16_006569 [Diplocarpon rosae]|uniref:Uncharacterized protein n=1 Tax=Diplocarpon rosae TaxID=946125 RepID=A0AAD9SUG2_9HELO|nr:hypothetical protein QTJ16_006569 [Diplocarpon rosae]